MLLVECRSVLVIAFSDDKERLRELTANDEYYKHMDEDAFELTKEYAHIDGMRFEPNEKGEYDMCQAIEDMKSDARIEGKILAYSDMGMNAADIATKIGQTVDFVKDTLKANGLVKA